MDSSRLNDEVGSFLTHQNFISYSAQDYAKMYLREMVRLNGVPLSIILFVVLNQPLNFGSHIKRVLVPRVGLT